MKVNALRIVVLLSSLATTAHATPLNIHLSSRAAVPGGDAPQLTLVLKSKSGDAIRRTARIGGTVEAELSSGLWTVSLESSAFWASPVTTWIGEETEAVNVELWPKGFVEGVLTVPDGESLPNHVSLRFQFSAIDDKRSAGEDLPSGVAACEGRDEGRFRCGIPAGSVDLRLKAPGFITQYLWDVQVPPGEVYRWGRVVLRPGASVVGYVTTSDETPLTAECSVKLVPMGVAEETPQGRSKRQEQLVEKAGVNEEGFFHLDGVPPGFYRLIAEQAPYAPTEAPVEVLERREAALGYPLVLAPPARFDFFVDPPIDPSGEPWQLRLLHARNSGQTKEVALRPVSLGGHLEWPGLVQGSYRLVVERASGERWHYEELELDQPEKQVFLDLPFVEVEGEVFLGDEPLSGGSVVFGGSHGAVRQAMTADEDGRFEGILPRDGKWRVSVVNEWPSVHRMVLVAVEPSEGRKAEVTIRLPDCRVSGKVVDQQGKPVAEAIVEVVPRDLPFDTGFDEVSDARGEFSFAGLPEGYLTLEAWARGSRRSELVGVDLREDVELPPVTLRLEELRLLKGEVVAGGQTVPGAMVSIVPGHQPNGTIIPKRTGITGIFQLGIPVDSREVLFQVGAPGFAYRIGRAPIHPVIPLMLPVDQVGGTLVLEAGEGADADNWLREVPRVLHAGGYSPLVSLRSWAELHQVRPEGGRLEIPMMEPGEYAFCWVRLELMPQYLSGLRPRDQCAAGRLDPFGQLTLKLPEQSGRESASR